MDKVLVGPSGGPYVESNSCRQRHDDTDSCGYCQRDALAEELVATQTNLALAVESLRVIAGERPAADNLMGNADIARETLKRVFLEGT